MRFCLVNLDPRSPCICFKLPDQGPSSVLFLFGPIRLLAGKKYHLTSFLGLGLPLNIEELPLLA